MTHDENKKIDWETYAAELYDTLLALAPYQKYLLDIVNHLPITTDSCVLDAGCGTGNLTQRIAHKQPKELWAIDTSNGMLRTAAEKCGTTAHTKYADLQCALPFINNQFDCIACGNVLYTVTSPQQTLQELWRVLKPKGTLVVTTPKIGYENGLILKEHCQSNDPETEWLNFHASPDRERELVKRTFEDADLQAKFIELAKHNNIIKGSAGTTLFTKASLRAVLMQSGFVVKYTTTTYAEQNLLAVCTKGA